MDAFVKSKNLAQRRKARKDRYNNFNMLSLCSLRALWGIWLFTKSSICDRNQGISCSQGQEDPLHRPSPYFPISKKKSHQRPKERALSIPDVREHSASPLSNLLFYQSPPFTQYLNWILKERPAATFNLLHMPSLRNGWFNLSIAHVLPSCILFSVNN